MANFAAIFSRNIGQVNKMAHSDGVDLDRANTILPWPADPSETQPAMDNPVQERYYRCYFIGNDHILGYKNVFSDDDVGAIEKLGEILAATEHLSVELWRGKACVAKLDKILPRLERKSAR